MSQTVTTTTTESAQVQQPNAPDGGHLYLAPQQENDVIITQTEPTTVPPPEYSKTTPADEITPQPQPQPQPAVATGPPPKIQPGLENRSPITLGELGDTPNCVQCPLCEWRVITRVEKHSGDHAMKMGVIACLCLGILLAWIPCVIDDCKDSEHFCPNCGYQIAIWEKGAASSTIIMTPDRVKQIKANPTANPPKREGQGAKKPAPGLGPAAKTSEKA